MKTFSRILPLSVKVALLGCGGVLLTAASLLALAMWQSGQYHHLAQGEVDGLIGANLDNITQGIYNLVRTEDEAVQQQVNANLKVARHILTSAGGVSLSSETVVWRATNQFTDETTPLSLPKMLVGGHWLGQNTDPAIPTPVVDEVTQLVGETATLFQRINKRGEMLRVATSVQTSDGKRAIGTTIPAVLPDNMDNPVITTIMKGETYRGRAFVVNAWYLTAYEPIKDNAGNLVGMLYVGLKQQNVAARVRQAIQQTKVGKSGYVFVLGGKGHERGQYMVSKDGQRDGENIWTSVDAGGRFFIQELVEKALALKPGELATERYPWQNIGESAPRWKIARLAYYAPWDWVIGTSAYEDELQNYQAVLSEGRRRMTRVMGLAGLAITFLIGLAGIFTAWTISHPIVQMTQAAETIIRGDLNQVVKVNSRDEIGVLAGTFNYMTQQLKQTLAGLHKAREELEARVEERTIELLAAKEKAEVANQHLEERVATRTSELSQANRRLRLLSAGNQAILRITDEAALLRETCRILVEIGGYPSAWVGIVEYNGAKTLRPAFAYGIDATRWDTLPLAEDQPDAGQHPAGVAIRSGKPHTVSGLAGISEYAPRWRDEMIRLGCQSSIALPLRGRTDTFGILNINARASNAFQTSEEELLIEFAQDMAYGITALKTAAESRKNAEALLQERILLRTVIDNVPDPIYVKDLAGRRILTNLADIRCAGVASDVEVLGKTDEAVFPKNTASQFAAIDQKVRETGQPVLDHEELLTNANGVQRWLLTSRLPLKDKNGLLIGVVGIGHDITERKQAQEAKAKLELQVRQVQKLEALGTLAGGIAHDFNNILTAILSYAEMAKIDGRDNPSLVEDLAQVLKAGERAKELVRQILAFSRQTKPERKPIHLHAVVKEALSLTRSTLPATIEIVSILQPNTPMVLADSTQVHQVLMNLCTNAAHAMRERPGRLTIRLDSHVIDSAKANSNPQLPLGAYARLWVNDTGTGMDGETLKRIFDPFFTTKAPGEGTGLGLAVVHGIMQDHQGAILVDSQPGVGTTFQLFFPAFQGKEIIENVVLHPPRGHGEHILFVDDESAICLITRRTLERMAYRVTAIELPRKAVEMFQLQPQSFDLVITDLTMPGMTGLDLADQIHQIRPDIPIILTTGYSGVLTNDATQSLGIVEVLSKPITPASLGQAIHRILANRSRPLSSPM